MYGVNNVVFICDAVPARVDRSGFVWTVVRFFASPHPRFCMRVLALLALVYVGVQCLLYVVQTLLLLCICFVARPLWSFGELIRVVCAHALYNARFTRGPS